MQNAGLVICFNCSTDLPERAKFCRSCRTQVRCKECDTELGKGDEFCMECGAEIKMSILTKNEGNFNTISIRETATERNIEAKFSNEVGKDLTGILRDAMMANNTALGGPKINSTPNSNIEDAEYQEIAKVIKQPSSNEELPAENEHTEVGKTNDAEYPAILNIAMKALPATEVEWVLVYCFYASDFGKKIFTRQDVADRYDESNRKTSDRINALSGNFRALVKGGKVSALTSGFSILNPGIASSIEIISRTKASPQTSKVKKKKEAITEDTESGKASDKKKSIKSGGQKRLNNIDFHPERKDSLQTFFDRYAPKNDFDRIFLFVYYMKVILEIEDVTYDHIYTCFEELDLKTPLDVAQITRNSSSKRGYIDISNSKSIQVTTNGKNQIRKWNDNAK